MREKDPVKRLHNLCDFLEQQKHESPYSAESWDELQAENDRLRWELAQCCKQHEQAASELWDLKQQLTSLVIK
ncbi:MAG: hypothetical protein HOO93_01255 [Methyloglobulus sp.]|nr:hypothetical protein [Methyloglobulus sp.]